MLRLLLDAHVSGRVIVEALRKVGHNVLALSEERAMEGLDDPLVLELAASQRRILVTHDIKDFAPLLRLWAEADHRHAGCILGHGLDHADFGPILRGLERHLSARPDQDQWTDLAVFLTARQTR